MTTGGWYGRGSGGVCHRAASGFLPPNWPAHQREKRNEIAAEDLGDLTDIEILKESVRRNARHGRQLDVKDKRRLADQLWRDGMRDECELADLLSITAGT